MLLNHFRSAWRNLWKPTAFSQFTILAMGVIFMNLQSISAQANTYSVETKQVFGAVTGDNVRIRKTPEIIQEKDHVIGKLFNGDRVEILEEFLPAGKMIPWYKIKSGSIIGWMRSDFILKD